MTPVFNWVSVSFYQIALIVNVLVKLISCFHTIWLLMSLYNQKIYEYWNVVTENFLIESPLT